MHNLPLDYRNSETEHRVDEGRQDAVTDSVPIQLHPGYGSPHFGHNEYIIQRGRKVRLQSLEQIRIRGRIHGHKRGDRARPPER